MWQPPPWRAGDLVKVVWRSTGTGDISVLAIGPGGREVLPVTGPTAHAGSSWDRPGDEWGTSFRLDEPGDWQLTIRRGQATASVPVTVTA
jgi:hypothetical protein